MTLPPPCNIPATTSGPQTNIRCCGPDAEIRATRSTSGANRELEGANQRERERANWDLKIHFPAANGFFPHFSFLPETSSQRSIPIAVASHLQTAQTSPTAGSRGQSTHLAPYPFSVESKQLSESSSSSSNTGLVDPSGTDGEEAKGNIPADGTEKVINAIDTIGSTGYRGDRLRLRFLLMLLRTLHRVETSGHARDHTVATVEEEATAEAEEEGVTPRDYLNHPNVFC